MIAIGGAIGVGLFLGSSVTIHQAGPGVIVTYILGAILALIMSYALAEMAVVHPVAGAFGIYAEKYLSPWAGFAVRATYALIQILAVGAEVTAAAIYFRFWFPSVPQWLWVLGVSAGLVLLNTLHVGNFGEFEYWFALIKVLAIILFVLIGAALIFGFPRGPAIGFRNLIAYGGFLPHGWTGVWLALTLAITSYMGVEIIAVTAGEAQQPEKTIPRAMRTIVYRLIMFYILAMTVMLAMTPWDKTGGDTTASPFVRAFAAAHIPFAAGLMNLVVITAALSSCNTDLYLSTRMIFSLARQNYAPAWLGAVTRAGVPLRALAVSTAGMAMAILLAIYAPSNAFLMLLGTAVAGMFFVWGVILLAHINFRRSLGPAGVAKLPLRLAFSPVTNIVGVLTLAAISITTFFVSGMQYTVPAFIPILLLITLAYWRARRKGRYLPAPDARMESAAADR